MSLKFRPFFFLFFTLLTFSAQAAKLGLGVGAYALSTNAQKNAQGSKSTTTMDPGLSISTQWAMRGAHFFMPRFGAVMHKSSRDTYGKQSKMTMFLLWDCGYRLNHFFTARFGLGTFMTKVSGKGEVIKVANGTSGTPIDAYQPQSPESSAFNTTVDLGFSYAIDSHWALDIDTYTFAWVTTRRYLTYSGSLNYHF